MSSELQNRPEDNNRNDIDKLVEFGKSLANSVSGLNDKVVRLSDDVDTLNGRVDLLLRSTTLDTNERRIFRKNLSSRVREIIQNEGLGGDAKGYLYKAIYNDIYDRFGVDSYQEIPRESFQSSLTFLYDYKLSNEKKKYILEKLEA